MLLRRQVEGKAPTERLWRVSEAGVRGVLKRLSGNASFQVKDSRTWHGTEYAKKLVRRMSNPLTEKEKKRKQRIIATAVAERLGNTPAVAMSAYISPKTWEPWELSHEG